MGRDRADGARADDEAELPDAPYSHEIPLFAAVRADDLASVRALLEAGASPHVLSRGRETPLFVVRSEPMARLLLDAGVPLGHRNWLGWDALTSAASDADSARIDALLSVGADPNATHDRGFTVLMTAVGSMERRVSVLERLVRGGADVHAVTELSNNAFHAAVDVNGAANRARSVRATMRFLHKRGVDLELRDQRGWSPLAKAIHEGTAIEVAALCEIGADVDAVIAFAGCGAGSCPTAPLLFHALGAYDASEKVESLLRAGVDRESRDEHGTSAIDFARKRVLSTLEWPPGETRDAVLASLRRCLELLGADGDDGALGWRLRASEARRAGDRFEALRCAEEAIRRAPDDLESRHTRALSLQELGRLEEAATEYRALVARAPDASFGCKLNLGNTMVALRRFAEALEAHDAALAERAGSAAARTGRGQALMGLGRIEEAERAFDAALEADASYVTALIEKSSMSARRGEQEAALRLLEQAVEIEPRHAYALSNLGSTLSNLGRHDDALVVLDRALAVDPAYWHPQYCRGCTLALLGRDDEALEAIARALSLDPNQRGLIAAEPDLVSLRSDARFAKLVAGNSVQLPASS